MTLRKRAETYFGRGNTSRKTYVPLGRHRCAFVSERRLWLSTKKAS